MVAKQNYNLEGCTGTVQPCVDTPLSTQRNVYNILFCLFQVNTHIFSKLNLHASEENVSHNTHFFIS